MPSTEKSLNTSRMQTRKKDPPKTTYLTNKERFEMLEQRIESMATAMEKLSTAVIQGNHSHPHPSLDASAIEQESPRTSLRQEGRTSTPKKSRGARKKLIPDEDISCDSSIEHEALQAMNLHSTEDKQARQLAAKMVRDANARFPHSNGKAIFDQYLHRQVQYPMPRHFIGLHSQRRVKALESHDDLNLPEFIQGYSAMILQNDIKNSVAKAMVLHLHKLGEALTDYCWEDMRDWANNTLHDVGQGRCKWTDYASINEQFNATKMRAAGSRQAEYNIPACGLYNQGKCDKLASHGAFEHICVSCWINSGAKYPHPFHACRRRGAQQQQARGQNRDYQQSAGASGNNNPGGNFRGQYQNNQGGYRQQDTYRPHFTGNQQFHNSKN